MDSMLGQIKDIVESKDPILYDHIHKHVVKRWEHINVPLHALPYVLTPKYYSPSWLARPTLGDGVKRNSQSYLEVQVGYMVSIDKLVPDEEECVLLRSELSKYLSDIGSFGTLHARKDRDRVPPIEWWNMHGSSCVRLHKLATKVLS